MIRKAKITDVPDISALLGQLGYPADEQLIKDKLVLLNDNADHELLIYEQNEKVIGFISIHFIPQIALAGDFANITYFCVDENTRSKGIGTALLDRAKELVAERKCDRIFVHCNGHRINAHRFYERNGYIDSPKYYVKKLN
jgi:N-acetylglutamate synthase-like GNAT family acetyltransferase